MGLILKSNPRYGIIVLSMYHIAEKVDYMALIKCPECGKEVSDKAKNCTNCGFPIRKTNNDDSFPSFTILTYFLFVFFIVSMLFLHIGWVINSILLISTFVFSIISLRSKEKLCILSAIPLFISGIVISMLLIESLIV